MRSVRRTRYRKGAGPVPQGCRADEWEVRVVRSDLEKPRRKWTSAETVQIWLAATGILVAIIALVR